MLETALSTGKLFVAGRLFRDNTAVMRQLALGAGAGAGVTILLGLIAPLWLAGMAGGAVAGFAQPLLFKNLKFA